MISTLTVSGSLIVSGGLTVNQLARKGNIVVQLDASPSTYTAYEFNSGSQSGTETSILNWTNRWSDTSGNNNHAYPVRVVSTPSGISYSSSFFPITSSYLNNGINVFGLGNTTTTNLNDRAFRFNPINESSNSSYSIFTWVKFNINTSTFGNQRIQVIIQKRTLNSDKYFDFGALGPSNSGPFYPIFSVYSGSGVAQPITISAPSQTVSLNTWIQYGITIEGGIGGSGARLYVNGTQVAYNDLSLLNYSPNTGSRQILMGRFDWASNTARSNYNVSQVLIYNTCLTPQEVRNNYQITKYKHQT
jgi:hypothetical protein